MNNDKLCECYFKPMVLVTGFGPFDKHPVNASWEAVKLLKKEELEKELNIELVLLEIPVTYENVDEFVPALWETHTPKLMVHVGVSDMARCLTLERQAHRRGYARLDYFSRCPTDGICPVTGANRLQTGLDLSQIATNLRKQGHEVTLSDDAGRYLCEYIYYHSLSVDRARSLFVHVPPLTVSSAEATSRALASLLGAALAQLRPEPAAAGTA